MSEELTYIDSDGARQKVRGCKLSTDKAGRYWLWSDALKRNLSYKIRDREDCLLEAIDSLLFHIHLRDQQISAMQRIVDLASDFADQIKGE